MNDRLDEVWKDIKTQRDELRVQMHLANAELKEEWASLEPKWQVAQKKFEDLKQDTGEAANNVQQALSIVTDELSTAYRKIKSRLEEA